MEEQIIQDNKIQKFIKRLYRVTNDDNIPEITWRNNGITIYIPDKENFRRRAMSHISKANEYTAFLRSIHHYNFVKLRTTDDNSDEYYHKDFIKDREDLLVNITRTKDKGKSVVNEVNNLKRDLHFMQTNMNAASQNLYSMNEEIGTLRNKLDKQEQTINGLIDVLSKVFRLGISNEASQPALASNARQIDNIINNHSQQSTKPIYSKHMQQFNDNDNDRRARKVAKLDVNSMNSNIEYSTRGDKSSELLKNKKISENSLRQTLNRQEIMNYPIQQNKDKAQKKSNSHVKEERLFDLDQDSNFDTMFNNDFDTVMNSNYNSRLNNRLIFNENNNSNSTSTSNNNSSSENRVTEVDSPTYFNMPIFDVDFDCSLKKEKEDDSEDIYKDLFY